VRWIVGAVTDGFVGSGVVTASTRLPTLAPRLSLSTSCNDLFRWFQLVIIRLTSHPRAVNDLALICRHRARNRTARRFAAAGVSQ